MSKIDTLADALDAGYIDVFTNGQIMTDKEGNAILNEDGKPIRTQPTAAMFTSAANWVKYRQGKGDGNDDPIAAAMARAQQAAADQKSTIPDLDDDEDPTTR